MELTEYNSEVLERAAMLGRARVARAYAPVLGNRSGLYRGASESLGNNIYVGSDGVEVEYWQPGEVPATALIQPLL